MKLLSYVLLLITLTASFGVNAEILKRSYIDEKNNVHVVSSAGRDFQLTTSGDAASAKLADNKRTVAWLVVNKWIAEGDTEPQSEEIKIYQDGKIRSIKCSLFIRDFWFWLNGKQIAIDCGGSHFAGWEILYDTTSLRRIASFDQGEIPFEKRPDWSRGDE